MFHYLRYLTCNHNFKQIGNSKTFENDFDKLPIRITKTFLCLNCGKTKKVVI